MTQQEKYSKMFTDIEIRHDKIAEVKDVAAKILTGKTKYKALEQITGVPWYVIGLIHSLEASCNFTKHLYNGDPLTARTVQVPKGQPKEGAPPFTFEQSAVGALKLQGLIGVKDWGIGNILHILEGFNGYGYTKYHPEVNTPYLWSYSQFYNKGKYASDGKFDANLVSKQAGVACVLKYLL